MARWWRAPSSAAKAWMPEEAGAVDEHAPRMTDVEDVLVLIPVQPESTVSRTILRGEGVRVVMFAFDAGQELTEHTAAVPVLLQVLDGHLRVTADGRTVDLRPGGVVHLGTRLPHAVYAAEPSRLMLTMVDPRMVG